MRSKRRWYAGSRSSPRSETGTTRADGTQSKILLFFTCSSAHIHLVSRVNPRFGFSRATTKLLHLTLTTHNHTCTYVVAARRCHATSRRPKSPNVTPSSAPVQLKTIGEEKALRVMHGHVPVKRKTPHTATGVTGKKPSRISTGTRPLLFSLIQLFHPAARNHHISAEEAVANSPKSNATGATASGGRCETGQVGAS